MPDLPRPRGKRRGIVLLVLAILLIGLIVFAATSDNPIAQGMEELVGWQQDQTILDKPFAVGPHTFRYYKFSLPQGSVNIAVVGQFAVGSQNTVNPADTNPHKTPEPNKEQEKDKDDASDIEVFVLTDADFPVWQSGRAASSLYDSGIVPAGTLQAAIPAGVGTYYLVFSNKSSPKTPKSVHATVRLRYQSWLRRVLTRHNSTSGPTR